jgi:hypothetical protein
VFKHLLELLRTTVLPSTSQPPLLKIIKYTFNFTDKSVLTSLSLFSNSGLLFTVLLLFFYSTGLLCIISSVILLCFCSVHHLALLLFSFCAVPSLLPIPLLIFFFLLFPHFLFRTINPIRSPSFSFMHSVMTVPLPLSMGDPKTSVLATETLTGSSS